MGVLTYVLLTGHSPFGGDSKQETFLNISQGQVDFPKDLFCDVSDQAIDFITRLLIVDPRYSYLRYSLSKVYFKYVYLDIHYSK